ncbi:hypothetical protein SSX86_002000 [Deinandra increscens subsp. villosa]|uniref:Uncharacterized protein n=1 Tax=Deinandra increscens subsp. villosa TaxID=3103831 RepID=A0AAP0DRJ6_9ASTR
MRKQEKQTMQAMYQQLRLELYDVHTTFQYARKDGKRHRLRGIAAKICSFVIFLTFMINSPQWVPLNWFKVFDGSALICPHTYYDLNFKLERDDKGSITHIVVIRICFDLSVNEVHDIMTDTKQRRGYGSRDGTGAREEVTVEDMVVIHKIKVVIFSYRWCVGML